MERRLNLATQAAEIRLQQANRMEGPAGRALQKSERLPFTIRIVGDERGLQKAVDIRRSAYGRHLPEFAEKMVVERSDLDPGTVVLLAESWLFGEPLVGMRMQPTKFVPPGGGQYVE